MPIRCYPALFLLIAACGAPRGPDPFRADGEVIAFGGGGVGAKGACFSCHGISGEGDGRHAPRLAGLDEGYLHRQLDDFATGRRDHAPMRTIAGRLSDRDRAKVSAYYAKLGAAPPAALASVSASAELQIGQTLYRQGSRARGLAPCAACHGEAGEGVGPGNPPLAGQSSLYMAAQLRAWRNGRRQNDPLGAMRLVSRRLAPNEIEAVAAYAALLEPR